MNETLDALQSLLVAPVATPAAAIVWALIGLVVGSFLNVVIHRIPQMMQRESDNYMAMENDDVIDATLLPLISESLGAGEVVPQPQPP